MNASSSASKASELFACSCLLAAPRPRRLRPRPRRPPPLGAEAGGSLRVTVRVRRLRERRPGLPAPPGPAATAPLAAAGADAAGVVFGGAGDAVGQNKRNIQVIASSLVGHLGSIQEDKQNRNDTARARDTPTTSIRRGKPLHSWPLKSRDARCASAGFVNTTSAVPLERPVKSKFTSARRIGAIISKMCSSSSLVTSW